MSGFAIELGRERDARLDCARRMQASLGMFGSDRRNAIAQGRFAITWVQNAGFTPQDPFERQPVSFGDRWRLVMVGRLSHRGELGAKLCVEPGELESMPDCDLALRAWCKWGHNCPEHLYGSYSIAVCDLIENRLIAFRGSERSQHLYWFRDKHRLILSTSTKAIFAFSEIPREIDDAKLADLLVLDHEDSNRSYFRGVSVLPSSSMMVVGNDIGEPRIDQRDAFAHVSPIRYARDEDYVEHANQLLGDTVAGAFRVPGLPAISLSGGLDSTSVAVAMIDRTRRDGTAAPGALRSYTGIPENSWDGRVRPGRLGDESGPVRAFAAMYPELDPHFVSAERVSGDQGVDMIETYADMPVRAASNAWGSAIFRQCRYEGHRLMVSGAGGNGSISLSAANELFAQWLRTGHWIRLACEARFHAAGRDDKSVVRAFAQAAIANLPDQLYKRYLRWRGYDKWFGFEAFSAIRPEFAQDMKVRERMAEHGWDDHYRLRPSRRDMMRTILLRGTRNDTGGLIEPLKAMTGVEMMAPLEDRKLVEFCYAIPDDQFYAGGADRRLVRRMMAGRLPRQVQDASRGEQESDWHTRNTRDLARIREEVHRLDEVPSVASRIDTGRMIGVIENWPSQTPVSKAEYPEYAMARFGIGRALSVARFINQVEGRN